MRNDIDLILIVDINYCDSLIRNSLVYLHLFYTTRSYDLEKFFSFQNPPHYLVMYPIICFF